MIKRRQLKEPIVGATQIISQFIIGVKDLREFNKQFPDEVHAASSLFSEWKNEIADALDPDGL